MQSTFKATDDQIGRTHHDNARTPDFGFPVIYNAEERHEVASEVGNPVLVGTKKMLNDVDVDLKAVRLGLLQRYDDRCISLSS